MRSTIDSVIHTCLSAMYFCEGGGSGEVLLAYSHVKISILQLGINCVCVPWGDGGRSTITGVVRSVASMLRNDPDLSVASAALSALCVFDAFTTPRAPPLLIPTRGSSDEMANNSNSGGALTASALLQRMDETRMEMAASKVKEEQRTKKSNKKKSKTDTRKVIVDAKAPPEQEILNAPNDSIKKVGGEEATTVIKESVDPEAEDHDNLAREKTYTAPASNEPGSSTIATDAMSDHQGVSQNSEINNPVIEVTSAEKAVEEDVKMKEENNDDGSSIDDFPDINVDEDPDEEDMK